MHGTQCVIQYTTNRNPAQSLQENAITVFGPRLYISLPKYLRDMESVKIEKFKLELDKFLELIADEPGRKLRYEPRIEPALLNSNHEHSKLSTQLQ